MTSKYEFPKEIPKMAVTVSGNETSASFEETNRIRVALGLKPLRTSEREKSGTNEETVVDVRASAIDDEKVKQSEAQAAKLAKARSKKKLLQVKSLGDDDDDDEISDAKKWALAHKRRVAEQKRKAEEQARRQAELDRQLEEAEYTTEDLRGLTVGHGASEFEEGQSVIMTLKDGSVLDEEGDELENVNMVEKVKDKRNKDRKSGKGKYMGYDDFDGDGTEPKSILKQYDDVESENPYKQTVTIGEGGEVDEVAKRKRAEIRERLAAEARDSYTLDSTKAIARDFYTSDEVVQMKKRKNAGKKKKMRRKKKKADGIIDTSSVVAELEAKGGAGGGDHGSRKGRSTVDTTDADARARYDVAVAKATAESQRLVGGAEEDDEDDALELHSALSRARRLAQKAEMKPKLSREERVAAALKRKEQKKKEEAEAAAARGDSELVFDTTQEFVSSIDVGDTAGVAARQARLKREVQATTVAEPTNTSSSGGVKGIFGAGPEAQADNGWDAVNENADGAEGGGDDDDDAAVESLVSGGLAATLAQMRATGFLTENGNDLVIGRDNDKAFVRDEGKEGGFKLEYRDDAGNLLSTKEAWRQLCYKFHGYGRGKTKQEKFLAKREEKLAIKALSGTNAAFGLGARYEARAKQTKTPHVVLSGSAAETGGATATRRTSNSKVEFGLGKKRAHEGGGDEPKSKKQRQ